MPVSFGNGTLAKGTGGGGTDPADQARITVLENVQNEYEIYYSIASGTSGTATIPTGSSIVAAQYGTANGLVVQVDASGKPTDIAARTAAGAVVTVTLNTGTGAYTLSGTPSAYPVALVYQVLCSAKDAANIPVASIIDWTVAKGTMSTQNADAVAITGGNAALSTLSTTGDIQQQNANYLRGRLLNGTSTRLFGLNSANSLYIGGIDASQSETLFVRGGTVQMTMDAAGNLGIGTSSPGAKLDVRGNATFTGNATARQTADFTNTGGQCYVGVESSAGGAVFTGSSAYAGVFGTNTANPMHLATNGAVRATVDTSGNIGVGTTSPASRLHVATDDSVGGINTILRVANLNATRYTSAMSFTSSPGNDWKIGKGAFSNDQDFAIGLLNGTELLRLNTSGNLGIGTSSPGQKLSVVGTIESTSGGFKFPDGTIQTTASAGGGGGGVTVKTSTINVASGVYQQYTTSIVDASVSTSSSLNAWLAPNTDWDADDLIGYNVILTPQTGSIDVCISAPGPIVGDFSLKYFIA